VKSASHLIFICNSYSVFAYQILATILSSNQSPNRQTRKYALSIIWHNIFHYILIDSSAGHEYSPGHSNSLSSWTSCSEPYRIFVITKQQLGQMGSECGCGGENATWLASWLWLSDSAGKSKINFISASGKYLHVSLNCRCNQKMHLDWICGAGQELVYVAVDSHKMQVQENESFVAQWLQSARSQAIVSIGRP